jgi:acyl carrier protein phosphodiesterase
MNILAHLCLSEGIHLKMLGNYIGDFVKGKQYLNYPEEIQKGILLHRKIDFVADKHPLHKQTRDLFRPAYGLYSGIVTDIMYDHILASHWDQFHPQPLEQYAFQVYNFLETNFNYLPTPMKRITPYMIRNNWLVLYRSIQGLEQVLIGMSSRTSLPPKAPEAIRILNEYEDHLTQSFPVLWDELKKEMAVP